MRAVDVKPREARGVVPLIPAAIAAGEASVGDADDRRRPVQRGGRSEPNALDRGPHHAQIAPGVDAGLHRPERTEPFDRAVDGVPLRDAAQIDPDRPVKAYAVIVDQLDVAPRSLGARLISGPRPRENPPPHELGRHRHVEAAGRALGDQACPAKHLEGCGMHRHGTIERLAVEPAHVALGVVEAHAAMDQEDLVEGGVDGPMRGRGARVGGRDLDEGAEKRPAPPHLSA